MQMEHWSWAAEKGVMNKNSASGLRAACVRVLGLLDEPDQADLAGMDIEDFLTRFRDPRKQRPKPQVLETYQHSFRSAVKSYKDYSENPGAWKLANRDRSGVPGRRPPASNAAATGGPQRLRRAAGIRHLRFVNHDSTVFQMYRHSPSMNLRFFPFYKAIK